MDSTKDGNELFVEKVKVNLDAQSNVIKEKNDSLFSSLNIRLDNFEKEIESNKSSIESIKKENQEFYSRVIKESNDSNEKIISQLSLGIKELKLDLEKTLDKLESFLI